MSITEMAAGNVTVISSHTNDAVYRCYHDGEDHYGSEYGNNDLKTGIHLAD